MRGLVAAIQADGHRVVSTREPGGTPVAQALRELFSRPPEGERLTMASELFLVCAGRSQHVTRVIRPAMDRGDWVVSDRFADSTRVYQGMIGGVDPAFVERAIAEATGGLEPDITFVLDCDVDVALGRLKTRVDGGDGANRYDDAARSVHVRMRECYGRLATMFPRRIVMIDASRSPEEVVRQGVDALRRHLATEERR